MAPIHNLNSALLTARQYYYNGTYDTGLPGPAIAGIVVSVVLFFIILISVIVRRSRYGGYNTSARYDQYPRYGPNTQGVWNTTSGNPTYPQSEFGPGNPSPMMNTAGDVQAPPPMYTRSHGSKALHNGHSAAVANAAAADSMAANTAAASSAAAASSSAAAASSSGI